MVCPFILPKPGNPSFAWNLDANVGLNAPNREDDVQFVQLAYHAMLRNPNLTLSPEQKAVYGRIRPGDRCSGREDDPLVIAIRTHEKAHGGTQDGHVSKLSSSAIYADANGRYTGLMVSLNNNLYLQIERGRWPRIETHPACPPALRTAVTRASNLF